MTRHVREVYCTTYLIQFGLVPQEQSTEAQLAVAGSVAFLLHLQLFCRRRLGHLPAAYKDHLFGLQIVML